MRRTLRRLVKKFELCESTLSKSAARKLFSGNFKVKDDSRSGRHISEKGDKIP